MPAGAAKRRTPRASRINGPASRRGSRAAKADWLITRGANLPILLIFAGVIGGLLSFGVIGLFIGPVILAVSYTLLKALVIEGSAPVVASPSSTAAVAATVHPPAA